MVIGLLGLGTVGGGVYEMLTARTDLRVKYVCCLEQPVLPVGKLTRDFGEILSDPEVDAVVEVMGGLHPAKELVFQALRAGKHVVTANKKLLAECYSELLAAAAEQGVALRCTAAVGGGIPWLNALERVKRADVIREFSGIMNGTTNYILDLMQTSSVSFDDALSQAQALGYAERDPSTDIDGEDTQNKLVVSVNIAFDACIGKSDILVRGIRGVSAEDVETFRRHGLCCRFIASAIREQGVISAVVQPTLVRQNDMASAVHSNYNLITCVSRHAGKQSFYGQGAGRYPTAYNVVVDLLDVQAGKRGFYSAQCLPATVDNSALCCRFYVRAGKPHPWLQAHTESVWESGVVTAPVPVQELHAWAAAHPDACLFFAALR